MVIATCLPAFAMPGLCCTCAAILPCKPARHEPGLAACRYQQIHAEPCYTGILLTLAPPQTHMVSLLDALPVRLKLRPCVFVHAAQLGDRHEGAAVIAEPARTTPDTSGDTTDAPPDQREP